MKRRSFVAGFAGLVLAMGVIAPSAMATQSGDDSVAEVPDQLSSQESVVPETELPGADPAEPATESVPEVYTDSVVIPNEAEEADGVALSTVSPDSDENTVQEPSSLTSERGLAPELSNVRFEPGEAQNICPAATASSQLTGKVKNALIPLPVKVSVNVYNSDNELLSSEGVSLDNKGNFTYDVSDLSAGTYTTKVMLKGSWTGHIYDVESAQLTVNVKGCSSLGEAWFTPSPAVNSCPATTADTTLTGWIENFDPETSGVVNAAIYTTDNELVMYDPELEVYPTDDGRGYFNYSVEGLDAGEYYASVALMVDGVQFGDSIAVRDLTVEINDCASLGEAWFTPSPAVNSCPATTADTTLTGWIENFDPETSGVVNAAIYTTDNELVMYDPELEVYPTDDGRGYFNYSVEGLDAGEYYASVALMVDGVQFGDSIAVRDLTVEINDCASLGEVVFEPVDVTNTCPASVSDETVLKGKIANWDPEAGYLVGVGIYPDGVDEPVAGSGDVAVNEDGTFEFPVSALAAGEYYASVTLAKGDYVQYPEVTPSFTVTIKDCAGTTPEKPGTDKPAGNTGGQLPNTGAFALPILLVGAGALGGGYALKRRGSKW